MRDLPWQVVKGGMEKLREVGRLELIFHFYVGEDPSDDSQEGSEDKPFTADIRDSLLSGHQHHERWWISSVGQG